MRETISAARPIARTRRWIRLLLLSCAALLAAAAPARATVVVTLIWKDTTGPGVGEGTSVMIAAPGDTVTLAIRVWTDQVLSAHGVSLAFDTALDDELNLVGWGSWAGSTFGSATMTTVYDQIGQSPNSTTESTLTQAGKLETFNGGIQSGPLFLPAGYYEIGTAAFEVTNLANDGVDAFAFLDPVFDVFGGSGYLPIPSSAVSLYGAGVFTLSANVPEPASLSLLGLGLAGLGLAARQRRQG
jgi:hypothetical protein